jgi:hypothetical protein
MQPHDHLEGVLQSNSHPTVLTFGGNEKTLGNSQIKARAIVPSQLSNEELEHIIKTGHLPSQQQQQPKQIVVHPIA